MTSTYIVARRTFEARKSPAGSPERAKLNEDWLTSEYLPGHKYGLRMADGSHTPFTFSTKAEAMARAVTPCAPEALPGSPQDAEDRCSHEWNMTAAEADECGGRIYCLVCGADGDA